MGNRPGATVGDKPSAIGSDPIRDKRPRLGPLSYIPRAGCPIMPVVTASAPGAPEPSADVPGTSGDVEAFMPPDLRAHELPSNPRLEREAAEAPPVRARTRPEEPSAEEKRQHELLHEPYRSWCKACVAGRGRADPHVLRPENEKGLPVVGIDYGYLWERSPEEPEGEHELIEPPAGVEKSNPVVCGRCSRDRWIFAHLLRAKGGDDYNRESL